MHCMTIISTDPLKDPAEAKQTNNNRSKTSDKEHRHFFSWTLSVRVVEISNFWVICTQPPNLYCCRVAAVWSTLYEMQHDKDFTLAVLRAYSIPKY